MINKYVSLFYFIWSLKCLFMRFIEKHHTYLNILWYRYLRKSWQVWIVLFITLSRKSFGSILMWYVVIWYPGWINIKRLLIHNFILEFSQDCVSHKNIFISLVSSLLIKPYSFPLPASTPGWLSRAARWRQRAARGGRRRRAACTRSTSSAGSPPRTPPPRRPRPGAGGLCGLVKKVAFKLEEDEEVGKTGFVKRYCVCGVCTTTYLMVAQQEQRAQ